MTIFIDQDNTLNDFIWPVVSHARSHFGKKSFSLSRDQCNGYHLLDYAFSKDEVAAATDEMFSIHGFWEGMPIQPHAAEVVEELYAKHDVYIVTCPWPAAENCIPEKIKWIEKHLPFFDRRKIVFACEKKLLVGDIIIDDSPKYLDDHSCKHALAFDYPYNRNSKACLRARDWLDIRRIIEGIEWNGG